MARQKTEIVTKIDLQQPKVSSISPMDLLERILHETNQIIAQHDLKKYKQMLREIVNLWYASYSPKEYSRRRSLYYFANPHIEGDLFCVDYGLMNYHSGGHRASPEVIYVNSFQEGWHGGAIGGEGHPSPGTPYYRRPSPNYPLWGSPAAPGFSIEKTLKSTWDDYCNGEGRAYALTVFEQVIAKYRDILISLIEANRN